MKKKIFIFLFDGFSDWEIAYLTPVIKKNKEFDLIYVLQDVDSVLSMSGLRISPDISLKEINKKNYDDLVPILDTLDFDQTIQYSISTGQTFNNSVRDILFHVINHSAYHRGQIATEFKQSGLEPLLTDYIIYKMK